MVSGGKPKELNRRDFGDVLREMCEEVGMEAGDEECEKFVRIRNLLVHQGVFPANGGEPYQQCHFLDGFLGRFLLATLGYSSQDQWMSEKEVGETSEATG